MRNPNPKSPVASHKRLKIYAFGGVGEVGMNMLALQVDDDVVVLDCGVMFQDNSYLGLDVFLPNFSKLFELRPLLRGAVFTHGHEDHVGAVGYLTKLFPEVPLYASDLTKDLIFSRISEFPEIRRAKMHSFQTGHPFHLPGFVMTAVGVSHSIPDSHGLVLDSGVGRLVFSGDFRYQYQHAGKFERQFAKTSYFSPYLDRPIFCYFGDSTNVEEAHKTVTEEVVTVNLRKYIANQKVGLTVVTLFSSNMDRMARILAVAEELGKKVVLCGRSVRRYVEVGQKHKVIPRFSSLIIEESEIGDFPRKSIVAIATGSQAEPRSALMRMATGVHRYVRLEEGDHVLMSSRYIPGNERAISRMINQLMMRGVDVVTDRDDEIHTSGHAYAEESALTLKMLRPRFFIPVHGEYHHLVKHAQMATRLKSKGPEQVVLMRNGQAVELSQDGASFLPEFDASKWTYDCQEIVPMSAPTITQRKRMGRHGVIIGSLQPKLKLYGLGVHVSEEFLAECDAYASTLNLHGRDALANGLVQMRSFIKRYFRERFDKRPYVIMCATEFSPHEFP
jgi:ribonuclease J